MVLRFHIFLFEKIIENIIIRNHQAIGVPLEQEAELARKIDNLMQKPKSDYERTVAIDTLLNRNDDLVRS